MTHSTHGSLVKRRKREADEPWVEDGKNDSKDDSRDDNSQLEDGVSEEMRAFGVVLIEVPDLDSHPPEGEGRELSCRSRADRVEKRKKRRTNLERLKESGDRDTDDEDDGACPVDGRVVVVVEGGEEGESDGAEDAEDDGQDVWKVCSQAEQ
jgi:hypothetical protein